MKVYRFAELDSEARQRAIAWYQECAAQDWEPELDRIEEIFEWLGIKLDRRAVKLMNGSTRYEPEISYQIAYCQGDHAAFVGEWYGTKMNLGELFENIPNDEKLKHIATGLMALYLRHPEVQARMYALTRGGITLDWAYKTDPAWNGDEGVELSDEEAKTVRALLQALADWVYVQLRDDLEYQTSEENAIEGIEAMDYDFDETGKRI